MITTKASARAPSARDPSRTPHMPADSMLCIEQPQTLAVLASSHAGSGSATAATCSEATGALPGTVATSVRLAAVVSYDGSDFDGWQTQVP